MHENRKCAGITSSQLHYSNLTHTVASTIMIFKIYQKTISLGIIKYFPIEQKHIWNNTLNCKSPRTDFQKILKVC